MLEVVKESEAMVYLSEDDLNSLKPENYIGLAPQIVDSVIAYIEEVERQERT